MEHTTKFSKKGYPEEQIRKALYWLSESCQWKLDDNKEYWVITLTMESPETIDCKAELDRLINDFILRKQLDDETKHMRKEIVSAALKKLSEHGRES